MPAELLKFGVVCPKFCVIPGRDATELILEMPLELDARFLDALRFDLRRHRKQITNPRTIRSTSTTPAMTAILIMKFGSNVIPETGTDDCTSCLFETIETLIYSSKSDSALFETMVSMADFEIARG